MLTCPNRLMIITGVLTLIVSVLFWYVSMSTPTSIYFSIGLCFPCSSLSLLVYVWERAAVVASASTLLSAHVCV